MNLRSVLPACCAVLLLTACGPSPGDDLHPDDAALLSQPADARSTSPAGDPETSASSASAPQAVDAVAPVALADNSLAVGSAVGPDGAVMGARPAYTASSAVHASVPVEGYAPGIPVTIYWFAPNGVSVKTESKPVAADTRFLNFALGPDDKLSPGNYTAQVDVGETPVGMVDFVLQ